tara:strand:+ start:22772 stop:22981 length:210 start_codon:yes stop_codon:yes gene_type:complete
MGHIKGKLRNVDSNIGRTAGTEQRLNDIQNHIDKVHGEYVESRIKQINQQVESGKINVEIADYLKSNIK